MVLLSENKKIYNNFSKINKKVRCNPTATCKFCGEEYYPTPRQKLPVCQNCRRIRDKCLKLIKKYKEGIHCKHCNNVFIVTKNKFALANNPWKREYCSFECYAFDSPDYVDKTCFKCGKTFPIYKKYENAKKIFCSKLCRESYIRYQKCERCEKTFSDKKVRTLCLDCFFDDYATKCLNCGKTLKKDRKRIITEENYNYLLNTLNFSPKKLKYFKISNMQYCDINCVVEKESPYYYEGINDEEYPPEFNKIIKRKIMERDNNKCQLCGQFYDLAVHHIDYNKQNTRPENLITLCRTHHLKTNWNRKYWVNLFSNYQLWRGLYD